MITNNMVIGIFGTITVVILLIVWVIWMVLQDMERKLNRMKEDRDYLKDTIVSLQNTMYSIEMEQVWLHTQLIKENIKR